MTTVLIDGDLLVYTNGFASQKSYFFVEGTEFSTKRKAEKYCDEGGLSYDLIESLVVPEPIENCLHSVRCQIGKILSACDVATGPVAQYEIFLTGKDNFRDKIASYYKENRKDSPKPHYYNAIREYLIKYWGAEVVDGFEADDKIHMRAVECGGLDIDYVVCSCDKDLNMVVGKHYNWQKDLFYTIDKETAGMWFCCQLLLGDRADNIPGINGIGPRKAYKLLEHCDYTVWKAMAAVWKAYKMVYGPKAWDNLLERGHLLFLRPYEGKHWVGWWGPISASVLDLMERDWLNENA